MAKTKLLFPESTPKFPIANYAERIRSYDHAKNQDDYQRTLITFVKSGFCLSTASSELIIHRNTLKYRLQTLSEICGLDLKIPDNIIKVYLELTKAKIKVAAYVNLYGNKENPQMALYQNEEEANKHRDRSNYLTTIRVTGEGDYVSA